MFEKPFVIKIPTADYCDYSNVVFTRDSAWGRRLLVHVIAGNGHSTCHPMTDLSDAEMQLKEGRFWNFDPNLRDNGITIDLGKYDDVVDEFIVSRAFKYGFGQIIEWIAENSLDKWSFHIGHQGGRKTLTMFFANVEDAVFFRLSLQRE